MLLIFKLSERLSTDINTMFGSDGKAEPQQRVCRFYSKHGACRFGLQCRYVHDGDAEMSSSEIEDTSTATENSEISLQCQSSNIKQDASICKFYSKNKKCWRGLSCKFAHVNQAQSHGTTGTTESNRDAKAQEINEGAIVPNKKHTGKGKPFKKLCRFFKRGECAMGNRCRFYHPGTDFENNSEIICKGNDVEQKHSQKELTEPITPVAQRQIKTITAVGGRIKVQDLTNAEQESLRNREIDQLKKRYSGCTIIGTNKYCITFIPTDPDWPYEVKEVTLCVEIPIDYPKKMLDITLSTDQSLPMTLHKHTEGCIQQWLLKKEERLNEGKFVEMVFRPFLRWLDKNIEEIFTEGLKKTQKEMFAKAAGLEFVPFQQLQENLPGAMESRSSSDLQEIVSLGDNYSCDDKNMHTQQEHNSGIGTPGTLSGACAESKPVTQPKPHGTEVEFRGLQLLESAATLLCTKFAVTMQCSRCKNRFDITASPNQLTVTNCAKCFGNQLLKFEPCLMHPYSNVCGYIEVEGSQPFDLLLAECEFLVTCLECNKNLKIKELQRGMDKTTWCNHCHQKMKISLDRVQFKQLQHDESALASNKNVLAVTQAKKAKPVKDIPVQVGNPLPDTGACKHYKKSFRWLRFPCCGKCYPCDVCHDENEDGHEMKFANRMVCGFCAKEQPYACDKPCSGCNSALNKGKSSHWEGGKGCRDKIKMSRGDDKKYTNQAKTESRHSQQLKKTGAKNIKIRHS